MVNKKILIMGGTGALGKTLIEKYYNDNKIIVFSRDEHKHYFLKKKYPNIISIIGDIRDPQSITAAIHRCSPDIIINAAALKHVPICQDNVFESIKTNVIGHQNVIDCVAQAGNIECLIFVSTDKACKPVNVYGMCKALAEELYINYANSQTTTKVVLVRYGNVLESTGSVVPLFKQMLLDGATSLPVTDLNMTRFLLTLEQATDLIQMAYESHNSHGKIAIPKIFALKIVDVANALISRFGKKTLEHIPLEEVGIRPGEKLHEEMISMEEWTRTEEHDEFFLIGQTIIRSEQKSYNSKDSLLAAEGTYSYLEETGVI